MTQRRLVAEAVKLPLKALDLVAGEVRVRRDAACPVEKALRFRYGVQVNSLGLTEQQAENNVQRIVLEALGVTLSKKARARSIQLPAWNEALGLPPACGRGVVGGVHVGFLVGLVAEDAWRRGGRVGR